MSKLASRIEKLERRKPARKVPSNDADLATWALESLFSSPQSEPTPVDGAPSPYLVFLQLIRSGEIEKEMIRRGIPLPPEDGPPEWHKTWLEGGSGKWSDEVDTGPRRRGGNIEPY